MNWGHQFACHVIDYYLWNALRTRIALREQSTCDFDIETELREGWAYGHSL